MRFVRNKLRKNQQKYFDDIDDEQKSQICYINEKNETKLNRKSFLVNKKVMKKSMQIKVWMFHKSDDDVDDNNDDQQYYFLLQTMTFLIIE